MSTQKKLTKCKAAVRPAERQIRTAFEPGDDEYTETVHRLKFVRSNITELNSEIASLKADLKEDEGEKEKLVGTLIDGKSETVACQEQFISERHMVRVVRLDTGEVIEEREPTDADMQTGAFDEEIDIEMEQ